MSLTSIDDQYFAILEADGDFSAGDHAREMIAAGIMLSKIYRDSNERWMADVRAGQVDYQLEEAIVRYEKMQLWLAASEKWLRKTGGNLDTRQLQSDALELRQHVDETAALLVDPRELSKMAPPTAPEDQFPFGFAPGGHGLSRHQS